MLPQWNIRQQYEAARLSSIFNVPPLLPHPVIKDKTI